MDFLEVSGTLINPDHIVFVQKRDLEESDIYHGIDNLMKLVVGLTDKSEISVIANVDSIDDKYITIKDHLSRRTSGKQEWNVAHD